MAETIKNRLGIFRESINMNQTQMAKIFGIGPQAYSAIEKGNTSLIQPHIEKLSELGLNIDWLFTGDGTMIKKGGAGDISVRDINNHGSMGDIRMSVGDCEKELELMRNENQYLQRILDEKERVIRDKQTIIELLNK